MSSTPGGGFKADFEAFKNHVARHNEQQSCACDDEWTIDPTKMDPSEPWLPFITVDEHAQRLLAQVKAQYIRRRTKIDAMLSHDCVQEPRTKANACSVCDADLAKVPHD